MAKAPWDDIAKFVVGQLRSAGAKKVRQEFAKKAGAAPARRPASSVKTKKEIPMPSKPAAKKAPAKKAPAKKSPAKKQPAPKAPAKKAPGRKEPARKAPARPKSSSGSRQERKTGITPTGKNVGRIAKTRPERKRRDFVSKDAGIMTNDSQRRAASRMGNRTLRRDGYLSGAGNKSTSKDVPVNVRGSVIKPPTKATMRPGKPERESFESDEMLRQFRKDLRSGLGRSSQKKKK